MTEQVRIVEVGPRDGLQNEADLVPVAAKVAFVDALSQSGLRDIEAVSLVNPQAVPQMADAANVLQAIDRQPGVRYWALVPNLKGLERLIGAASTFDPDQLGIALFTAASETFNRRNTNAGIDESLDRFRAVIEAVSAQWGTDRPMIRGYISTAVRCPYEGSIAPDAVARVAARLFDLGVDEVSLGDTIGAATPADIHRLLVSVFAIREPAQFALHLHDTRGTALANVLAGLQAGIRTFDSSAGGLGGCPFAPGATGNLATEDLVYMLNGMGFATGVDLESVAAASDVIHPFISHDLPSRELRALRSAGF